MQRNVAASRHRCGGLTLVELITTLAVAVIILGVGVPGYRALIDGQRVNTRTNALVAHLQLARSEAVKRGDRVAMCPSPDGTSCADSFDWTDGWLVFVDLNQDRERQDTEPVLRIAEVAAPLQIVTSTGRRRVVYEPDGSVLGGSNATFRVCSPIAAERNRAVIISITGRPRVSDRDADNQPVSCG